MSSELYARIVPNWGVSNFRALAEEYRLLASFLGVGDNFRDVVEARDRGPEPIKGHRLEDCEQRHECVAALYATFSGTPARSASALQRALRHCL